MSHFVQMPRLDLFAGTGYPFTRMADLAETLVILPPTSRPEEVSLFLTIMASIGAQTGYPGLRVSVNQTAEILNPDKDILVIGTFEDQPLLRRWGTHLVLFPDGNKLRLAGDSGFSSVWSKIPWTWSHIQRRSLNSVLEGETPQGIVQEFPSPVHAGRSVVALTPAIGHTLDLLADDWAVSANAFQIHGGVNLLYNGQFQSFYVNDSSYHAGRLPRWQAFEYWCRRYFWLSPLIVFAWIFVISRMINIWLTARGRERLRLQV
jgi:cellulose synthase (UDP-forming)